MATNILRTFYVVGDAPCFYRLIRTNRQLSKLVKL